MATTFTFTAGSTTHVTTLTVDGVAGDLAILNSSVAGSQWNIVYDGPTYLSIDYTAIQDSVATPDAVIEAGTSCVDLGNNSGWFNPSTKGLYFAAGSTQHTNGLTINGTSSDIFEFGSDTPGSSFDLIHDGTIPVGASYCRIFDCHASADNLFEADTTCINGGNTTGWFTPITRSLQFTAGSTTHVTTFSVNGASEDLIAIGSSTPGSVFYLIADGAPLADNSYLSISDSDASPDLSWTADSTCDNQGNNTGWFDTYQREVQFKAGSTNHFQTFTVNGIAGDLIILTSDSPSQHFLINDSGIEIFSHYLDISYSNATPPRIGKPYSQTIMVLITVGLEPLLLLQYLAQVKASFLQVLPSR